MASDFERILQKLGSKEAYLDLVKTYAGRRMVTAEILPASYPDLVTLASGNESTVKALHRDGQYTDLLTDAAASHNFDLARQYIDNALGIQNPSHKLTQVSAGQKETANVVQEETSLNRSLDRLHLTGTPVDGLCEYLSSCNNGFLGGPYYGRFSLLLQSSGTGKTHTIVEYLRTKVPGLYMNIRSSGVTNALPKRDDIPADILERCMSSEMKYADNCALKAIESGDEPVMIKAGRDLVEGFPSLFCSSSGSPKLVIAIDSARELGALKFGYRRSRVLCWIISRISEGCDMSFWVVFVASGTSVKDFSTPTHKGWLHSHDQLFPPFSQFGWDRLAKPISEIEPGKVAQLKNIAGFGRPLWKTLFNESHGKPVIMATACEKLCLSQQFHAQDPEQVLAVLGQRFCLDFRFGHRNSIEFHIKAISNHLRVCLDTTEDGLWHTALYPSEPVLSCAASVLLNTPSCHMFGTSLAPALERLCQATKDGLVEVANNGEPVSLIIYLVAKDLCVRAPGSKLWIDPDNKWSHNELKDCKPLQVTDYLMFLFGETALDQDMKETFSDWYIDFSDWIRMGQPITFPGSDGWSRQVLLKPRRRYPNNGSDSVRMHIWLARLWARTGAVQCCNEQRAINMLIPMYKLEHRPEQEPGNTRDVHTGRLSYILISDRAGVDVSRITPRGAEIPGLGRPYIAIHADLRAKDKKPRFQLAEDDSSTRCLRIYAPGVNAETYSFLEGRDMERLRSALQNILRLSEEREPLSSISLLKARAQYGHSVGDEHTRWEMGGWE